MHIFCRQFPIHTSLSHAVHLTTYIGRRCYTFWYIGTKAKNPRITPFIQNTMFSLNVQPDLSSERASGIRILFMTSGRCIQLVLVSILPIILLCLSFSLCTRILKKSIQQRSKLPQSSNMSLSIKPTVLRGHSSPVIMLKAASSVKQDTTIYLSSLGSKAETTHKESLVQLCLITTVEPCDDPIQMSFLHLD